MQHTPWLLVMAFTLNGVLHEQPIGAFDTREECEAVMQETQELNKHSDTEVFYRCVQQGTEL